MSKDNSIGIRFPVGRYVQGSLYEPQTTDLENRPLTYSTGPQAGQPRVSFYFGAAIPKKGEQHWSQTEWGAVIHAAAVKGFPSGQYQSPTFAWKITDGDSQIPNANGAKPCDREGFPGHWVLHFTNGFAPKLWNHDGTKPLIENDAIKLGDYIEIYGNVSDNGSAQKPGVYLNHSHVALAGYGSRIVLGIDPKSIGFGQAPLPMGASATPIGGAFLPPVSSTGVPMPQVYPPAVGAGYAAQILPTSVGVSGGGGGQPMPPPHHGILPPPMPPAPPRGRVMTALANGATYEQMIGAGWNDAQLIQLGYMQA